MNTLLTPRLVSRLLAGFGTAALIGAACLVSSRPAHTAGGPIAVTVANAPLPTTTTDNPDQQAVQFEVSALVSPNGSSGNVSAYTVPAGKRLVIDTISAFSDRNRYNAYCFTEGGLGTNGIATVFGVLPDGSTISKGETHPHQYAEAGTQVTVDAERVSTLDYTEVTFVFTGYLVDIATPGGSS